MTTQYYTATSLDGFLADADNSLEWLFQVPSETPHQDSFAEWFTGVGAMAMGATTYTWVFEHENLSEHPEKWREWYADRPAWVFTHRDLPAVPGATVHFVQGDVAAVHAEMVAAAAGKLVWLVGGGELVGQFADHGLLDEIRLSVAPVTLGSGAPLLPRRLLAADLHLTSVEQDGQFASLRYSVGRAADRDR
jgi:dihydrofolate reductase